MSSEALSPSARSEPGRSEATRSRVLDAAVDCIAQEGFHASNLARIARHAGMTTGAIQHQFRDKASLLAAVVERGFERMIDQLARLPGSSQPVEDRVDALVHVLWQGYDAASTRASLEILFAMRHDAAFQRRSLAFLAQMRERADRLWMGSFWDLGIDRARHLEAQRLVFTTLNGLALERILVPTMPETGPDLARLARVVVAILRADERPEPEGADR
ncbi:MAG: TetR/AcrR family transcriptional regulator [Myxococcota bacterium]